jgi:hypothetical protein
MTHPVSEAQPQPTSRSIPPLIFTQPVLPAPGSDAPLDARKPRVSATLGRDGHAVQVGSLIAPARIGRAAQIRGTIRS